MIVRRFFVFLAAVLASIALSNALSAQTSNIQPEHVADEAWADKFFEQWDVWFDELAFDSDYYFHESDGDYGFRNRSTPNLIDVYYVESLKKYTSAWSFAIEMVNKAGFTACLDGECKPVLRMVSVNSNTDELPDWLNSFLPTNREETARQVAAQMLWREADLSQCEGTISHLISFEDKKKNLWSRRYQQWLQGKAPDAPEIITVRADGDWLSLRASSRANPEGPNASGLNVGLVVDGASDDYYYDWALRMRELVEPCLKPSVGPPPWEKVLAAKHAGAEPLRADR